MASHSTLEMPAIGSPPRDNEGLVKWIPILVPLFALALVVDVCILVSAVL